MRRRMTNDSIDPHQRARELLTELCRILDDLNGPDLRARVEITWDRIPQIKVMSASSSIVSLASAHWCDHGWKVYEP
jgi:hypothetical protein